MVFDFSPLLIGFQVLPASSVRKAPAAEMAMYIRSRSLGSWIMVCRHMPPAPGIQCGPDPCPRSAASSSHVAAPSVDLQGRIFHAGVNRVGVRQRRLQVPDPLELP